LSDFPSPQQDAAAARADRLELTVLGSGTSMGVPALGCHCAVCRSSDAHDKRTRPSILLSRCVAHGAKNENGVLHNVVIDTTPDFRFQALRAGIDRLDAVVFTHAHADHILGFDDIRPYNMRQKMALPVYASDATIETLRRTFAYVFQPAYEGTLIPQVTLHSITGPFELLGATFTPIPAEHGPLEVFGFRVGGMGYLTDIGRLPESSKALLGGLDDFIIDALRDEPQPTHQTVDQAVALIRELRPKRAWFTHIAHDLPHAATNARLVSMGLPNVQLAYDGLQFEVRI
jgi:phosphoribosyl 1,2-cyclic phosphate phosphodiesterase